jgi:hypothetical protein
MRESGVAPPFREMLILRSFLVVRLALIQLLFGSL